MRTWLFIVLIAFVGLTWAVFRYLCQPKSGYLADNESWSIDPDDWMSETEKYWWDE